MKVRYSPRALAQLEEIHKYIAEYNPRAAAAVVARIQDLCEKLGEFPGMGAATDHHADARMRHFLTLRVADHGLTLQTQIWRG
jgi:plasmid stabilization system protein ParE